MEIIEHAISEPFEGVLVEPVGGSRVGVLVLAGSSGRIDVERCRVLARAGMTALSIRWFGGDGQAQGICEIPLERFVEAIDLLQTKAGGRVGVLGFSKGAEAALLLAVRDPRVDAVVAMSPTSVVWANVGPGIDGLTHPYRSSWTWRGEPVPFISYDDAWTPAEAEGEPTTCRTHYEQSRQTHAEAARAAVIPIEQTAAQIVLVAGGDDQMWPSLLFAQELAARRASVGRPARLVTSFDAGHRPRLPGEGPAGHSDRFRYGGTAEADAALGTAAWSDIVAALAGDLHTGN
ncbi:acyl-CoA thioesterase [Kitasatospora sp. NBC_00240]|uniref:acyl-CoA thioester hydrolase/BAAT C-terminal domain-containing protein n=1 Tax=Kitasatospora sp. NBC_00240 TaxID=2903567 RepID=UPI00225C0CAF|nr:acyl-CoA thioester hydrolase/BAAT C-terminal domain-containing protein [Kitasatospora sp. NBC_00240]MCX5215390.1 acyl-CoA thioesterase [Kitasatospora sp. NBC_00240]MCX5215411.1 acyl-CoA thioesterase [Kitasatospora sp. NBC_00240]